MKFILVSVFLFSVITSSHAQDKQLMPYPKNEQIFVYPKYGQTEEQVQDDKFQCYQEAMNLTGFDPTAIPRATTPSPGISDIKPETPQSMIDGDYNTPDKNYSAGEAQKEWKTEELNKYETSKTGYNKVYKSCLEKLGYSIN